MKMSSEATIVKGEDVTLTVNIRDADDNPYSLSGITEITARFPKDSSTAAVEKTLTDTSIVIVSSTLGQITIALTDTDTALMKAGSQQSLELFLDVGTTRRIVQLRNMLSINAKLFT
jgi:hypothetical protein